MEFYVWMCFIVFVSALAYNGEVRGKKLDWKQIALVTFFGPIFIGVCIGILAAERDNER